MKKPFLISGIVSAIISVICIAANVIYNATTTYSGAEMEVMKEYGEWDAVRQHEHELAFMDSMLYIGIALLVLAVVLFVVGRRKNIEEN